MNLPSGKLMALLAVFAAIGVITGTGAFTTVSAERTASVNVAGDASALLGLSASGSDYASVSSGTLELDMAGGDSDGTFGDGAKGLNLNAKTTVQYVFTITNNGGDEVAINIQLRDSDDGSISDDGNYSGAVAFVVNESQLAGDTASLSSNIKIGGEEVHSLSENKIDLDPGESIKVGMYIDTRDADATDGNGGGSTDIDKNDDLVDTIDIKASSEDVDGNDDETGNLDVPSP